MTRSSFLKPRFARCGDSSPSSTTPSSYAPLYLCFLQTCAIIISESGSLAHVSNVTALSQHGSRFATLSLGAGSRPRPHRSSRETRLVFLTRTNPCSTAGKPARASASYSCTLADWLFTGPRISRYSSLGAAATGSAHSSMDKYSLPSEVECTPEHYY